MKKNRQHIDEIRFLVIHLILVNHWMLSYDLLGGKVNTQLVNFVFELTSPTLSLMSGYLFFYGTQKHFGFVEKVKRRVPSLVIPYVIWSLGFFIIYYLVKEVSVSVFHSSFWYQAEKPPTVRNALMALVHPPVVNFWYLQNLILILPFNFLFYYLLKSRVSSILLFIVVLFIFAYNPFSIYFEARFLPFYMMGCFFGYHEVHVPKFSFPSRFLQMHTNTLVSVSWVPLTLIVIIGTGFLDYEGILLVLLKLLVVLFFVISTYNLLDANPNSLVFRYLRKFKPYSFFLFAIHTFIFTAVQRPLIKLVEDHLENKYFTLGFSVFTLVIVLIVSLALGAIIKNKLPRFFGVITGR
jgi:fucose 4-O-acetylase-like acetyltransferase